MLTVIAGDWPAQSVLAFKQGFGGPNGLIISTGILKHEEINADAVARIEVVTDANSPLIAGDDQIRQLASLFFASKEARQGRSLVLLQLRDARRMLVKANQHEVGQLTGLLREAQKAAANPAGTAPRASETGTKIAIWIGVFFLPIVFVWALLGKGHSTLSRVIGFGWAAMFVLFVIASSTSDAPPAPEAQPQAAASDVTTAATPAPTGPTEAARADFLQTHQRFMALASNCDTAWDLMTEAIGTNDIYTSYRAADRGADICRDVSMAMGDLTFSSQIEGDTRRALNRAVDDCSLAMVGRQTAMEQAARIFDGNLRPSSVEQFRARAQYAQSQTISCMVAYLSAATTGGFEIPDPGN